MNIFSANRKKKPFIYEVVNKKKWLAVCHFCDSLNNVSAETANNNSLNNNSLNQELITELQKLSDNDSKMRGLLNKVAHDSEEYKRYWQIQNELDANNQEALKAIIKKYGYPGKSIVGANNAHIAAIIIQHAPLNMQEEYLPIIIKAQKEDEIKLTLVYLLVDRIHVKKYGKQIFGTQQIWDKELQKMIPAPIYSIEDVKKIKEKYNLE